MVLEGFVVDGTCASKSLNSLSFLALYSFISFAASVCASFTLCVRSFVSGDE